MNDTSDGPPTFEQLARDLSGPLSRYLCRMVGNAADADDLLQETLMRIARGLPGLDHGAASKSWAYRIATNVAIDHLRRNKPGTAEELDEADQPVDVDEEDRLILDEMNSCVREVIDGLPSAQRAAVVLFHLENRPIGEIAEILGVSGGAVKVRVHRARALLKEALGRECDFYVTRDGTTRCERKRH